jgi:hypothetical protein
MPTPTSILESPSNPHVLAHIYNGLATRLRPAFSFHTVNTTSKRLDIPSTHYRDHGPAHDHSKLGSTSVPLYSLLPVQLPVIRVQPSTVRTVPIPARSTASDSLTRERKGKMPALSHLLSIEQGKVLSLAADEQYVYAGCQSEDNEITVSCGLIIKGRGNFADI